jgi:membrane protein YdbS with pleckstrin-like domain
MGSCRNNILRHYLDDWHVCVAGTNELAVMNDEINTDYFSGLRDGENIQTIWRRNPITMARMWFISLILTLIVFAIFVGFGASLPTSLAIGLWLVVVPVMLGYSWYLWRQNSYVLTNERLIDISFKNPFNRAVAEIPMDIIQDVTYEVSGPIQIVFNFGTVIVQTASFTEVTMTLMTDPQVVQQALLKASKKFRVENGAKQ